MHTKLLKNQVLLIEILIDLDYHIKIFRKGNQILIQNNINYWNEFEDIKNHKFIISFFNKNRNYLEYYIPFVLEQLKIRSYIRIPLTVNLSNTKIHINSKKIKIKYENTSN